MTDKKLVVGAALPPLIVIAYSLLFKVDPITTLLHLSPYFTLSFFLAYLASNAVASVRDALLAKVPYSVAFKARLLGNAVGLVIPGALGGDLTRAVVYSKSVKLKLDEAFAISTVSAFYDVVIGSLMYLLLLIVQPKPLDVIFTLDSPRQHPVLAYGNRLFSRNRGRQEEQIRETNIRKTSELS